MARQTQDGRDPRRVRVGRVHRTHAPIRRRRSCRSPTLDRHSSFEPSSRVIEPTVTRLDDPVGNEGHRLLRERSPVQRRAVVHRDLRLAQDVALEGRRRCERRSASDPPGDVVGARAAAQRDVGSAAHGEVATDLEDSDARRSARQRDAVRRDRNTGAPRTQARSERHPADVAGAQLGEVGQRSTSGIRLRDFHVADGNGQVRRCRGRVFGRIHGPLDERRRRVPIRGR